MKKSIICLYCVIFSLISVSLCFAQGEKGVNGGGQNAAEVNPANDAIIDPADWASTRAPVASESVVTVTVSEAAVPETAAPAAAVPETAAPAAVDLSASVAAAAAAAAESAATAKSAAAAAAESAAAAKTAAAAAESAITAAGTAAAYPPPSEPSPYAQPAPAPSASVPQYASPPPSAPHSKPQPPVRTNVPTVTLVFPQSAPQAVPQAAPQAAPSVPPATGYINVIPKMPDPYSAGVYRVQVGSFSNTGLAQQCFQRLQSAGFSPFYEPYGDMYRVLIIGVRAAEMEWVVQRLAVAGFSEVWVREER